MHNPTTWITGTCPVMTTVKIGVLISISSTLNEHMLPHGPLPTGKREVRP
jgi:hypothetical protein